MALIEINSFLKKSEPFKLFAVITVSISTIGAGLFFGSFCSDILFDILKKYQIYSPGEDPSHVNIFRILILFIAILLSISIVLTISFLILRNIV